MAEFKIGVELGHLIPNGSPLTAELFPNLAYAVQRVTEAVHQQWVAYASGAPLPDGKRVSSRTGEYARSIQVRQVGPFAAEAFTVLPYASAVEEGSPARDMKRMLDSSLKVRTTAKGKRYLIIPFRWNHPNSVLGNQMPEVVHGWWHDPGASRVASHVIGSHMRLSGTGAFDVKTKRELMVPGWRYRWGTRLTDTDLAGMGVPKKQAQRMSGMVNFRRPGATGGASHSQFLTFRTMMEGSKGWIAPAREGLWPARTTADQFRPIAEQAFAAAVQRDIEAAIAATG